MIGSIKFVSRFEVTEMNRDIYRLANKIDSRKNHMLSSLDLPEHNNSVHISKFGFSLVGMALCPAAFGLQKNIARAAIIGSTENYK